MALASEQTGIGLRRHFTTPGVHPYDEVEWERRDARISNVRDGSVAFEQTGVEFPVSWSQNATNIVAQKYFRGALGTFERESSLRQVVDRIADTISRWGAEGGYFVDQHEAETFNAELKHILVTQKAAFNSPVWFNIGVHGVPAQASACFILSVDDSMDSILNWYREEGIIFKGGSGSGVNLSRIRSSAEQLAGGGTASGPVSFMRGADASAGTIKCLHHETPIVTERGVVPIRDIRAGDRVLTRLGYETVEAVHDNGVRPLLRVRTALGDEILCTPQHRFRVRGRDGDVWREARDLRSDDFVMIDMSAGQQGEPQRLQAVAAGHHREIAHALPAVLDEAFALWLGWIYGDGSITKRPGAKFVTLQLGDRDPELPSRYRALTRSVFGSSIHFYESRHDDRQDASVSLRFAAGQVIRFLEANGLRKQRSSALRVPEAIQSSPPGVRAAFLSGVFEADGHVGNGYPQLSTISEAFARDVLRLLLSLGIPATIGHIDDRHAAHGDSTVFVVRAVSGEGVRRFAKLVGFISDRKSRALEAAVARKDCSPYETQWFLPHVAEELAAVWASSSDQKLRRALSPYCKVERPRRMSLLRARKLLERFEELEATSLATFASGDDLYVPATVEPAGNGHTFDLTVRSFHQYLVNSVVTHNSGGKTRRAAKMVILDVDHPDIEEFIWCKAREERKARVLRDAGFDMDLDGRDSHSLQYQNANNSVRVTDEFMDAVENDTDWHLREVTSGHVVRTVKARELFRQICQAAWECADPGMQFDTTINHWHTAANTGRINASNPCFTGDTWVHTDKGLIQFRELFDRANAGEEFGVYTHDVTNPDTPRQDIVVTTPDMFMITGRNPIIRLRLDNGMELRCTPNHRIFTLNRGYVEAQALTPDDQVRTLDLPTPAINAGPALPVASDRDAYRAKGDHDAPLRLPETWSEELAHYLGWLVGDGSTSGPNTVTIYGSAGDRSEILPRHAELLTWINGDRPLKVSEQANGTAQLRLGRRVFKRFIEALGVRSTTGEHKVVPWSIEQAPPYVVAAFLRGLYDADGCAVHNPEKGSYVGLGSISIELLRGVQRLLSTLGIGSRVYKVHNGGPSGFRHTRRDGTEVTYARRPSYDLRITSASIQRFAAEIGFELSAKRERLEEILLGGSRGAYDVDTTARLVDRIDEGIELTYNLTEPRNHSYVANGVVVRNCSEYMHLDNSACNLASLNLLKFLEQDGSFDVEGFKHTIDVIFTAQEILVGRADYPTEAIGETSRRFRQLGLGYANLGALLMALGLPYNSEAGRAQAAAITSLMTGHAYEVSARTASRMGPFAGFSENREHMLRVLAQHQQAASQIDETLVAPDLLSAAQESWDDACDLAERFGVRNSQASVIAPTGTIGLALDCDTTGLEPDLGLVKLKKLVGGGTMSIVNQTVPRALERLGYDAGQIDEIVAYIDEHKSIVGAAHLDPEYLPVFACSMGDNAIHYGGHVKMMAAIQPFISGALSKTVNLPEDVSVDDVEQLHIDAWKMGIKAIAVYRDNCKVAQPLATAKKETKEAPPPSVEAAGNDPAAASYSAPASPAEVATKVVEKVIKVPVRDKMPRNRTSRTFEFRVADCKGFVTVGEYRDGRPGEIFLKVSKQGSTLAGIMDAFSNSVSYGLQYGVPLRKFVEAFTNTRFEPAGITDDPDLRIATSILDYIFRRLAVDYLSYEERAELGILTTGERTQPTLPGVEETVVETRQGYDIAADPPSVDSSSPLLTSDNAPRELSLLERAGVIDAERSDPTRNPVVKPSTPDSADAPYCMQCGVQMQRAGSCHACPSCGTTSGCS